MEIFDITQELFHCAVFPGDPSPKKTVVSSIDNGALYNLTELSLCAHNGTHVDAPYHFYQNGKTVDRMALSDMVGKCYVAHAHGAVTAQDAEAILKAARAVDGESAKRILIRGDAYVTLEAARVFTREKVVLVGNESQTVGPQDAPAAVHYELLGADVVLLEGIRLHGIEDGVYFLFAAPINLGGCDGAPCRAVLIKATPFFAG